MVDRSIKSAVIVILCAAVTFVFSLWLFEGKKSVKGYLSANFYALLELCRFAWYAFCIPVLHQRQRFPRKGKPVAFDGRGCVELSDGSRKLYSFVSGNQLVLPHP